jgi:hypothetical protein
LQQHTAGMAHLLASGTASLHPIVTRASPVHPKCSPTPPLTHRPPYSLHPLPTGQGQYAAVGFSYVTNDALSSSESGSDEEDEQSDDEDAAAPEEEVGEEERCDDIAEEHFGLEAFSYLLQRAQQQEGEVVDFARRSRSRWVTGRGLMVPVVLLGGTDWRGQWGAAHVNSGHTR